jgi:hypothetical protein
VAVIGRGGIARGGSILLPRHVADRDRGEANWPKCIRCRRAVDAYGIENETASHIELWARCDGIARDPQTGAAIHGAEKRHGTLRDSIYIEKGDAWTPARFTDIVRRQAFFAPDGDREWEASFSTGDGVKPA